MVAEAIALVTKPVVATCVVFVPAAAVGAAGVPVNVGEAIGAFNAKPGTVGEAAVPLKSPANWILPLVVASASAIFIVATCASTYVFTAF